MTDTFGNIYSVSQATNIEHHVCSDLGKNPPVSNSNKDKPEVDINQPTAIGMGIQAKPDDTARPTLDKLKGQIDNDARAHSFAGHGNIPQQWNK